LTVLSLRGNQLRELPPSVGKLSNLKELNLSQNGLRYLPYEILELFSDTSRLNSLHLHPNLFHEPQFPPSDEDVREEEIQQWAWEQNKAKPSPRCYMCRVSRSAKAILAYTMEDHIQNQD
jgi:Leucine Rich repeats (2 copies)